MVRNWYVRTEAVRREFVELLDADRLRRLHAPSGLRHGLIALRQALLLLLCAVLIVRHHDRWYVWLPSAILLQLYVLPLFFVFPVAFTINRLGQHYDIEPAPVFARHPMRVRTYPGLLFDWLVRNRTPHTNWDPIAEG